MPTTILVISVLIISPFDALATVDAVVIFPIFTTAETAVNALAGNQVVVLVPKSHVLILSSVDEYILAGRECHVNTPGPESSTEILPLAEAVLLCEQ